MTATRPRRRGKRAFLALFAAAASVLAVAHAEDSPDLGWRLTVIPSFERPALHENIPGSHTAILATARPGELGLLEYATTRGAWRWARDRARDHGNDWLDRAEITIRRGKKRVVERILITGDNPLLPALAVTPAFYDRFEPLLGAGFHVIIPDRNTLALYPRLAGEIPPQEAATLLEINHLATYPVSREVFRATRGGLQTGGILTEE